MKRSILMVASMLVVLCVGSTPGLAQRSSGGGAGPRGPASMHGASATGTHANNAASSSSSPEVLIKNTKLDSKLTRKLQSTGLLPAGTDLKTACAGFRNLGQCMAAIHVSHNRDIPFACLKADMTGTAAPTAPTGSTCPAVTGTSKMSLGKAIQTLDPKADARAEAKKAMKQADDDIKESESSS